MEDRRGLVIAFMAALIILVGGAVAFFLRGGDGELDRDDRNAEVIAASETTDTETVNAATARVETPAETEPRILPAEPERIAPPSFDIVRVDPEGFATMAGRGAAGAEAIISANDEEVARAAIDRTGQWVVVMTEPLPPGALQLSLAMRMPTGQEIGSQQVVVVSVPETQGGEPLVVLGSPGGASRVLQSPFDDPNQPLALLTVDYDEAGSVIFSGRAAPGSGVRVYADGKLVGESSANAAGGWSLIAGSALAPGRYNLQIDQLDNLGRVTAVIVAPFERAEPEQVEAAALDPRQVVVQPGNSLWRIARSQYGTGFQYTVIYDANAQKIRDPDLIYPGQIFDIPPTDG